jgi:hypothetical protein
MQMNLAYEQVRDKDLMEQRREMSRMHRIATNNAATRVLKDKGLSLDPAVLTHDYWAIACLMYSLGDDGMSPNPFQ